MRDTYVQLCRSGGYQLLACRYQRRAGVEHIVDDHGAASDAADGVAMHDAAGSSQLLEVNDLCRALPCRCLNGLAPSNCALVGGDEARVRQLKFSKAFTKYRARRERLER